MPGKTVFPAEHWTTNAPEALGLSPEKLAELSTYVGGNGVVVRDGYLAYSWGSLAAPTDIASAFKPLLSTYLMIAVQQGRIGSVDDPVANWEPRLLDLNGGKDAGITWRHLATMTSGYGLVEAPGAAFGYNDYAIMLYYDTLMKVFGAHGTDILRTTLAEPLQFEDSYTHDAFGPTDRAGRLAMSVRDFARVGLLYQRGGKWGEERLMKHPFVELATSSPIPSDTPFTSGVEAPMLPGQRNLGGGKNQSTRGPGFYSFQLVAQPEQRGRARISGDSRGHLLGGRPLGPPKAVDHSQPRSGRRLEQHPTRRAQRPGLAGAGLVACHGDLAGHGRQVGR